MHCVIEVLETRGSAPREAGTRMWVSATEVRGTIGGGNLEYTALKIAREMLLSSEQQKERRFALGDSLGQCCGGSVTLRFTLNSVVKADEPLFEVVLFGAGHVGKEVARILERLPCRLTWIDPRPEVFPASVNAKVVIEEEPAWMVDEAPAGPRPQNSVFGYSRRIFQRSGWCAPSAWSRPASIPPRWRFRRSRSC
jgi:xanthine dehydrogenase accessory factor